MSNKSTSTHTRNEIVEHLGWLLRNFATSAVLAARAIADKVGIGANDFKCAEILVRMGPMSAGELAERAGLTTGAITKIVDRLEKAGWAKRAPDPNDRRRIIVLPVPQDTATVEGLYDSYTEAFASLIARYSDAELVLITEFIEHLIAINEEQAHQE